MNAAQVAAQSSLEGQKNMKKLGILLTLVAAILLAASAYSTEANPGNAATVAAIAKAAKPAPAPIKVSTKSAIDATTHSVIAAPSAVKPAGPQQPPTLEQVDQQLMSLYIEAGARVERIRVAQAELEQINQSVQQLNAMKAKLTGKAPATAPVAAPQP
jgi:hypothetical protein